MFYNSSNTLVKNQWKQWLTVVCATIIMISVGTINPWITNLKYLTHSTDMPVEQSYIEESNLILWTLIGSILGSIFGAYLTDDYGRKYSLICAGKFLIAGWWVIIISNNFKSLCIARAFLGLGSGIAYTTNPVYVSEVADTNIRGALGTLMAINVFIGSLIAYSIGPYVSYTILGIISLIIPIIFVATFIWLPESPYFLAMNNKKSDAIQAITFLKNIDTESAHQELTDILSNINECQNQKKTWLLKMKKLLSYNNLLAILVVSIMIFMRHLSGHFILLEYLENILAQDHFNLKGKFSIVQIKISCLVPLLITIFAVEKNGRRFLIILSSFFCAIIQLIFSIYIYLSYLDIVKDPLHRISVIIIISFQLVYYIGLGVIPNLIVGEFFPTNVKTIASAGITILDCSLEFVIFYYYSSFHYSFKIYLVHFIFALLCFIGLIFILFFMPETKNKDILEIQKEFSEVKNKLDIEDNCFYLQ